MESNRKKFEKPVPEPEPDVDPKLTGFFAGFLFSDPNRPVRNRPEPKNS